MGNIGTTNESTPVTTRGIFNRNGVKTQKRGVLPVIVAMTIDEDVKTTCKKMGIKSKYINVTYNGNQLRAKLKELKMEKEIQVLDQFYFSR